MHPKTITNFSADLQNSLVFEALIKNHYGEPEAFKHFRRVPTDDNHRVNNANIIIKACQQIGISTHLTAQDIYEQPSDRELIVFVTQLYHTLPHYIPKATIEFPAVLGDLVTKNIELSNPSK